MKSQRWAMVLGVTAMCAFTGTTSADETNDKAPPKTEHTEVNTCLSMSATGDKHGVLFMIDNACPKNLRCTVSWSFRCGGEGQPSTRASGGTLVWANDTAGVRAEDPTCKEETWAVDDPSWECKPSGG